MGAMQRQRSGQRQPRPRSARGGPRRTPATWRGRGTGRKSGAALGTPAAPLLRWPRHYDAFPPQAPGARGTNGLMSRWGVRGRCARSGGHRHPVDGHGQVHRNRRNGGVTGL
jgi:hypothetical protein